MPRTAQASQQIREEQRARILAAAGRVFARKGLAATMDDIAAEASVSHGLAYRYFASKEAIFSTLVEQALQNPAADLEGLLEAPGTPGEHLDRMVTGLVESRRRPEFYQLLGKVLSDEAAPASLRELVRKRGELLHAMLRRLIVAGQASGEVVKDDPDQLVRAIFACVEGLSGPAAFHAGQYTDHFPPARIFLRMLKP